ncbi:pentatricopeptide repeat-containing protein [Tanacetum coccineum]
MLPKLPINLPPHLTLKLIKTYCDSGDLRRARQLFDKIPTPDLHSLTVLISAYTKQGLQKEAISLYTRLRDGGAQPDKFVLLSFVKACATSRDLTEAQRAYKDAVAFGLDKDILLGNAMIDMFGKCKCVDGARRAFEELEFRDVISWTSMCSCYVSCGKVRQGLEMFREMCLDGVRPNSVSVSSILPACSDLKCLRLGREIHGFVVKNGLGGNVFISSALVDMYASCLCLRQAELVFNRMSNRDIVSYNVMISAYFENGEAVKALAIFGRMKSEGLRRMSRDGTQDRGCGYFMWMDDLRLHISSSSGLSTPPSSYPGPSTRPSYSPRPSRSAQNLGKAECSNCKFLAEKIKTLEAKIKILEVSTRDGKHPRKKPTLGQLQYCPISIMTWVKLGLNVVFH